MLSYVNTLAELCDVLGADITDLTHVMGADPRIGADVRHPGPAGVARACRKTPAPCSTSPGTRESSFPCWPRRSPATPATTTR